MTITIEQAVALTVIWMLCGGFLGYAIGTPSAPSKGLEDGNEDE